MSYVPQAPGETLDHNVDWADRLASGDTISSASWAIDPAGPTVVDKGEVGAVVSCTVSGLVRGQIYSLTCTMISTLGETGQKSIAIRCDHN